MRPYVVATPTPSSSSLSFDLFQRHTLPGCYYRDSDFCFLDDNTGTLNIPYCCRCLLPIHVEGDYFDLSLVPERFTGYSGPDAHRIWRSIYEENCFGLSELSLMTGKSPAPVSLPDTMSEVFRDNGNGHEEHCLEKRVYYKIISGKFNVCIKNSLLRMLVGLHASISTHICREYLNQTTGLWVGCEPYHLCVDAL